MATLDEILHKMRLMDDEVVNMEIDEHQDLGDQLKEKIDSYKEVIDRFGALADHIGNKIDFLSDMKNSFEQKQKAVAKLLLFNLEKYGFEKMPGTEYTVHIIKSKSTETSKKCEAADLIAYDGYVRTKFEWDKVKIKSDFDKNEKLKEIAAIQENKSIKFTPRTTL